jgi:hypothetical protein
MRFPVDDVTTPLTSCELHILEGNATVKVATGVISPIDSTKTPRIHSVVIPPGYASISVDRVVKWIEWSKAIKMWLWISKVLMGRRP